MKVLLSLSRINPLVVMLGIIANAGFRCTERASKFGGRIFSIEGHGLTTDGTFKELVLEVLPAEIGEVYELRIIENINIRRGSSRVDKDTRYGQCRRVSEDTFYPVLKAVLQEAKNLSVEAPYTCRDILPY